jgi:antitoxin PrlF
MPRYAAKLSTKGQVTVPKAVRQALGASKGDTLVYDVKGKIVTVERSEPFDALFHAALSRTLEEWTSPEDDVAFRDL